MSDIDLQVTIPVQPNEINREKIFQNFWLPPGATWVPHISAPRPNFQKPLDKASNYPLGWPMQNFSQFSHVVSSIEGLRTKKVAGHFIKRRNL